MLQRLFTWLYGRLGAFYPPAFLVFELQSAWLVLVGTIGLFALYYDASASEFLTLLAIGAGLSAATMAVALLRTLRNMGPLRAWINGARDPAQTAEAWQIAANMPLVRIRRDLWLPIFCVALPGSVAGVVILGLHPLAFAPLFAGSLVALGYSGILHYLYLEAGLRPVLVDISRELPPLLQVGRGAIPLRYKLLAALPMINVITGLTAAVLSANGDGGADFGIEVLLATGVAFAISLELSVMLTKSLMRPIEDLGKGMVAVREGRYDHAVPVTTADELGELSAAFNQMVAGLAERERLREAFGTYLDREVAEFILSDGFSPEGFEVDVSILFCDVRDFTRFAAEADAQEVVSSLNSLFEAIVPVIARNGGHVDKFVGDGLLAVFGAPENFPDHADRAVLCAVEMAEVVNHGDSGLLPIGIGVNSGPVVAGSIGGGGRLNYSVIGDPVNVASRVESVTRESGDDVLFTKATRDLLSHTIEVTPRGEHEIRGRDERVELFAATVVTREHRVTEVPGGLL